MIPLSSKLESSEQQLTEFQGKLEAFQFTLGGNWEYNHGSFDRSLDEAHKVWLRLPFEVVTGSLDSEAEENDAKIRLGQPFVLKHLYNEGLDPEAQPRTFGSLFDQFQEPLDVDAKIEDRWVDQAKKVLSEVERRLSH
ncbi:YugN family protein [Paenibacillus abyssi]|uniref:YugN-like family protein n=1 Tax=Paenibacillus abyssi TaxID=1340531 RepID=A0A917CSV3_9BACL|nr:YugN family protein [Paenibacillus abyssi]GGF97152.1 hypothetical protein GCM10010916_13030 [Paenibacillus abyssi]